MDVAQQKAELKYAIASHLKAMLLDLIERKHPNGQGDAPHWVKVRGKPEAYMPVPHMHDVADIQGAISYEHAAKLLKHMLQWGNIQHKPTAYPPGVHTHTLQEIGISEDMQALLSILEQGQPGQYLRRTRNGFEWAEPPAQVVQREVGYIFNAPPVPPVEEPITDAILVAPGVPLLVGNSEGDYLSLGP